MKALNTHGKRILFANFPADGHFNPLTSLAVHLVSCGYDVRWYTSKSYTKKLSELNIFHYPFKHAVDVSDNNFDAAFPERKNKKTTVAKLKFDIINAFILRGPEYYADIQDIYETFPFDLLIADNAFTGIAFVKELMHVPVIAVGVLPLSETSKDLPPCGLGMEPSDTWMGKIKQALLRAVSDKLLFSGPNKVMHEMFDAYQIPHNNESIFDLKKSDLLLQSGTPGFEYKRSDMSSYIRFIGPLYPYSKPAQRTPWFDERLKQYKKIVLVTQGTVEKDVQKLIVPTLEAFKGSDVLVICTTGGSQTQALRAKYHHNNIIIEDFIPFNDVMPYAHVYITNGGYGGVMLGIQNNLPMVVAGVHEGKNEICARVGYFKLGINLKTEKPAPGKIEDAVNKILADSSYHKHIATLSKEFDSYNTLEIFIMHVQNLLNNTAHKRLNEAA
ncbi:glycosyltransferase [Panacibacter sp. DH6]|uniref:Glycosyltransferase n=1 Tax=Panacibacter microcysteis TaxID=2793269 RepID=A0A931E4I2_9BACT|nr:nucleotide disphospho-sugar-binding domain-containing protein [Panacibacter microcysteis]MBG9376007.1 glycosyltransferase [Panacibacter microcysteis]